MPGAHGNKSNNTYTAYLLMKASVASCLRGLALFCHVPFHGVEGAVGRGQRLKADAHRRLQQFTHLYMRLLNSTSCCYRQAEVKRSCKRYTSCAIENLPA
jgi:hypothetical protein